MNKVYNILLNGLLIGKTHLEKADAPMGGAFGLIEFIDIESPYQIFKEYCSNNGVVINTEDTELEFVDTQVINGLKVFRNDGLEIKGEAGNAICGMKDEGYEISVLAIGYPFYEEEFPHHVKAYREMFKE